jgi:hypothetical protein
MLSKQDLIGAWQLESWTVGYSDRDGYASPFGEEPQGLLLYTADDWMSASIGRSDRHQLPEDVPFRKLPEEKLAQAYLSYFHYAGRYRVVDGDVVHYVTQSLNPNFVGTEQLRHAELDGQTLVLSGRDQAGGVTRLHSLVWHRLSPMAST